VQKLKPEMRGQDQKTEKTQHNAERLHKVNAKEFKEGGRERDKRDDDDDDDDA